MPAPRAWLIDASIYIFRAWFSLPERWHTRDGQSVHAVYGYTGFLLDFIARTGNASHCAAAFDESLGSNYRNEIYPAYKSSRLLPGEELAFQLAACREITEHLGMACYGGPRFEADDYLASLARLCRQHGMPVTVVTRDKDLGQIIQYPGDTWWDFAANVELDAAAFEAKFGVGPLQFADYLALVGDPIDDIPGVPGVGAKTAVKLLQACGSVDALGSDLGQVAGLSLRGARGLAERLVEYWPQVLLSRQLASLEYNIPEVRELPVFRPGPQQLEAVAEYLQALDIGGPLLRRCRQLGEKLAA